MSARPSSDDIKVIELSKDIQYIKEQVDRLVDSTAEVKITLNTMAGIQAIQREKIAVNEANIKEVKSQISEDTEKIYEYVRNEDKKNQDAAVLKSKFWVLAGTVSALSIPVAMLIQKVVTK